LKKSFSTLVLEKESASVALVGQAKSELHTLRKTNVFQKKPTDTYIDEKFVKLFFDKFCAREEVEREWGRKHAAAALEKRRPPAVEVCGTQFGEKNSSDDVTSRKHKTNALTIHRHCSKHQLPF
jgi:hypothetical protein